MVKKILFMMLVAFATLATTSCSKDEPNPDVVATYTLGFDLKFDNFTDAEKAQFQPLIDAAKKTETGDCTLSAAKKLVDDNIEMFKKAFDPDIVKMLTGDQKITFYVNVYKGATTSGTPVYSRSIIATKDGAVVK